MAKRIVPSDDLELNSLIAASVAADLDSGGGCSHHSTYNLEQIEDLIGEARQEFLLHRFSHEFQGSLGYALHYIQDLLTIAVDDHRLHGKWLSLHDEIEPKLRRYADSTPYGDIKPESLEGKDELLSFILENIEFVYRNPHRALSEPPEALRRCFRTCLSVAKAVCNNEKGFPKGVKVVKVGHEIEALIKHIRERLDEMSETVPQTILRTRNLEAKREALQRIRWSFAQEGHPKAWLRRDLRRLRDIEDLENELSQDLSEIKGIIESGYEQDYETRQDDLRWYGLKWTEFRTDFKTVQELNELAQRAKEALRQAEAKRTELESHIQDEMARIDRRRCDKLLTYGRIALETGKHEQAREDFERALALDATNQEAREALAQIETLLARKVSPKLVKAPRVETREERAKRERRRLLSVGAGIAAVVFLIGLIASGTGGVAPYIAMITLVAFFCVWLLIHAS